MKEVNLYGFEPRRLRFHGELVLMLVIIIDS